MKNEYLLLTPGPLSTSEGVREAMLKDWCTWDDDYNKEIVEVIRTKLVKLATSQSGYTSVLMQGSGTASVEAALASDSDITHVAIVHCETTTGMLNPIESFISVAKAHNKTVILDAMSSFGGIPMDIAELGVDFMISSANKCIQGVPGFGFVIAKQSELEKCKGQARSLSLDLYDQWHCMETNHGKWRFTSPTHTVRAFYQALMELEQEGGIEARHQRYQTNQKTLVSGMRSLGFEPLLGDDLHSPIITSFYSPAHSDYLFKEFYLLLKEQGFVIYPGKVSNADCFRIGNIGDVYPADIERLIGAVQNAMYWCAN